MDHIAKAAGIIRSNRYMTLATTGGEGPWAAPLAYTVEPDFTLVFYSATNSVHCKNLQKDPRISGAIFDSTASSDEADGVQFRGSVREVSAEELDEIMRRYFVQSFPQPDVRARWLRPREDFLGSAPQRFYKVSIQEIFKPDPTSVKVDRRLQLDLEKVAEAYAKA